MVLHERTLNVGLGLSCLFWAVAGIMADGWLVVRCSIGALHIVVGLLFLVRAPQVQIGSMDQLLRAVPSLILSGVAFKLRPAEWPFLWSVIFAAGSVGAIVSLMTLGRSFALFPSLRAIVTRGPYRLVRHPVYLFELVMVTACCLASPSWGRCLVLGLASVSLIWRVRAEEALLATSQEYRSYLASTRWRLLPGVW